jgi:hypothetical protein
MFDTHKDITNNKHLVYFHRKKIQNKFDVLKFQTQNKQVMNYNLSKWIIKLLQLGLHQLLILIK